MSKSENMKWVFMMSLCLSITGGFGQKKYETTSTILVTGEVSKNMTITMEDILKSTSHSIGDLTVYNHLGERKSVQKGLKGVRLKDLLATMVIKSPGPRQLSEFYLTATASDGYKVVFSWNELFNSPTGDSTYLVSELDGVGIDKMEGSILLVCTTDRMTGRRNVKSVKEIRVGRAE